TPTLPGAMPCLAKLRSILSLPVQNAEAAHRRHVIHTWNALYGHDPQILSKALSEAWLRAAESTPTWVWALIDLPETSAANYTENKHFVAIIQQVRDFFHILIKVHKCDPDMVKSLSFRLGSRHRRYMTEGRDNAYWHPFAQQMPIAIVKAYQTVIKENGRLKRLFRIRVGGGHGGGPERTEEDALIESWRLFVGAVVENMRKGFEGCASDKTPMRLSITNSIISMASFRSTACRSRANSTFLEPVIQISPSTCRASSSIERCPEDGRDSLSPSPSAAANHPHNRSRSIFRARPTSEMGIYRRLSSPNRPYLSVNDVRTLTYDADPPVRKCSVFLEAIYDPNGQRRSLTLLPGGLPL
ncbi:hypothetical protein PENTCL1PPCAC_5420, partial [Pristionchus entomophagus]